MFNEKYVKSLEIYKNADKGEISIVFEMDESIIYPSGKFLIRIFDKNGNYLTHFTTEEFFRLFEMTNPGVGKTSKFIINNPVMLSYNMNTLILKEAKYAEFGIY